MVRGVRAGGRRAALLFLLIASVTFAAALAIAVSGWSRGAGAAGTTIFTGRVLQEPSSLGYGLSGVFVSLEDAATGTNVAATTTGSDGRYEVATAFAGHVRVKFARKGFASEWHPDRAAPAATAPIVSGGGTVVIDAAIGPPAVLGGVVRYGDRALGSMWVQVMHADLDIPIAVVTTGSDGRYVVSVPSGSYRLRVLDPLNVRAPAEGLRPAVFGPASGDSFADAAVVSASYYTVKRDLDVALSSAADCRPDLFVPSANLSGRSLAHCDMSDANLGLANLAGANLQSARLNNSRLGYANLGGVSAHHVDLRDANLGSAKFIGADLRSADLRGSWAASANFTDADLRGAHTEGANLTGAIWSNTTCPDGSSSDAHGATCAANLGGPTFTVDDSGDGSDEAPGDGFCDSAGGGCTLRAAVDEANASGLLTTIEPMEPARLRLDKVGQVWNEDTDDAGDIDVFGSVILNGDGLAIDQASPGMGVFDVAATGSLDLRGVVIKDSSCCSSHSRPDIENDGVLTVHRARVDSAGTGLENRGEMAVDNSQVEGWFGALSNSGTARVIDSTIVSWEGTSLLRSAGSIAVGNSVVDGKCVGALTSDGFNTVTSPTCSMTSASDRLDVALKLRSGHRDSTLMSPYTGSSIIDSGRPGCSGLDLGGTPVCQGELRHL